jgi:hypothetical protein
MSEVDANGRFLLNSRSFCQIASLTEQLKILRCVAATLRDWNDMVEMKPFTATAFFAPSAVSLPDFYSDFAGNLPPLVIWFAFGNLHRGQKAFIAFAPFGHGFIPPRGRLRWYLG